jgi:hypothetical protein
LSSSTTLIATFAGIAKPIPTLPPFGEKIAVLTPMTSPAENTATHYGLHCGNRQVTRRRHKIDRNPTKPVTRLIEKRVGLHLMAAARFCFLNTSLFTMNDHTQNKHPRKDGNTERPLRSHTATLAGVVAIFSQMLERRWL